jgi:dTDP-4-dehydrorhamnose reductase
LKILITGSNGLLGQKLVYRLAGQPGFEITATSKGINRLALKDGYRYLSLDITSRDEVQKVVSEVRPDCIINTAAMTNVDACENDKTGCQALNIDAVQYLTDACKPFSSHFIHLSTDFVFDGENGPYREDDIPNPLSFYAWSKLESEKIVMNSGLDCAVLRTIIIYGVVDDVQRSNLVLWTKSSLEKQQAINVITDQFRSPTLAEDLSEACVLAAQKRATGIFHVCGPEEDLDSIINIAGKVADFFGLDKSYIKPVTSAELNQSAKRPLRTGFILDKARHELGYRPTPLNEGLQIIAQQLQQKKPVK